MGKRLSEKNPFLRDAEKKKRLLVSAISSSQRQEGIEISDTRAEEVYKVVFEEPPIVFFRLNQAGDNREDLLVRALADEEAGTRFEVGRKDLLAIEGGPLLYWIAPDILRLFRELPKLDPVFGRTRSGLNTTEIQQFVRFRWEVAGGRRNRWVLFAKGGDYSRFYADWELVFDWTENGRAFKAVVASKYGSASRFVKSEDDYFKPGITWMQTTNLGMNARILPGEGIFGVASPTLFLRDERDRDVLLAVMNSSMFDMLARCVAIRNWGATAIGSLPVLHIRGGARERLNQIVGRLFTAKREWDQGNEISSQYQQPWLSAALRRDPAAPLDVALNNILRQEIALDKETQALYSELDSLVFDAYGVTPEMRERIAGDLGTRPTESAWPHMSGKSAEQKRMEHVWRLLSSCVKSVIERDDDGIVPLVKGSNEPLLEERVMAELENLVGIERLHEFEGEINSELRRRVQGYKRAESVGDWLTNVYFEYHVRLYKNRPIYWHLASSQQADPAFGVVVHYHRFGRDAVRKVRGTYVRGCLERLERELGLARQEKRAEDAVELQQKIEEVRSFDKKLQGIEEGEYPIRVPWKDAAQQPKGWSPDIDDGVKINILPFQIAGLLRIATVVSAASEEDE